MLLSLNAAFACVTTLPSWMQPLPPATAAADRLSVSDKKGDVYNILWRWSSVLPRSNILGWWRDVLSPPALASISANAGHHVVVVSVFLLVWEMLYLFRSFPSS